MSADFEWEEFVTIDEHDDSDKEDNIKIEDILALDATVLETTIGLQYQNILISYLSSYFNLRMIKNQEGNRELVTDILKWIATSSKFLAIKIDQSVIEPPHGEIKRSSYQFCDDNVYCSGFYNRGTITCTSHHYVHSMVYTDVTSMVYFIEKYDNLSENDKQNIKKSIDTIKFVIDHMLTEYTGLENYMPKAEDYHRDNLSFAGKNRKRYNKPPILPKYSTTSSRKLKA